MNPKVRELMSPQPEPVFVDETMDLAHTILTLARIRHLPVTTREGQLVGLVTQRDLERAVAELYRDYGQNAHKVRLQITEIMTKEVTTIGPDEPILKAAELIWDNKFGCLPVVDGDRIVGIITEADFVKRTIQELSTARV